MTKKELVKEIIWINVENLRNVGKGFSFYDNAYDSGVTERFARSQAVKFFNYALLEVIDTREISFEIYDEILELVIHLMSPYKYQIRENWRYKEEFIIVRKMMRLHKQTLEIVYELWNSNRILKTNIENDKSKELCAS